MNLEDIEKKESRLIELIYKYFSILDDYRNGKGKKDAFQYLYEEISDFYLEEKNQFDSIKYGGMVTEDDRCIICLGEAEEEENPLYSHEHIAVRGEDGIPTNKNTACFFHVDCLKDIVKHKLRVPDSEIDNYFIECPMCKSVLISSKLDNYDNDKKRFVAMEKPNTDDIPGFNLIGFRNMPDNRIFNAIPNIFVYAIVMLLWILFFISVYYHSFVNQENTNEGIRDQAVNNLQELSNNLYVLSSYARRDENEAIRVLNQLVSTFYDNINYDIANRIRLNDNMDNNDEFIEAFRIALNGALPHDELGGKKKRKKKSMKRKNSKNKRPKKNKTKKKKN